VGVPLRAGSREASFFLFGGKIYKEGISDKDQEEFLDMTW
jgi:hypothetical protein